MRNYNYKKIAKNVIAVEIIALKKLNKSFNNSFSKAIDLIAKCRGKIILAGIGKSGLISRKISATLSSVGTPSFYLNPGEAAHGDLGQINNKDILLILSYSGETEELKNGLNSNNINPMDYKKLLAHEIVKQFYTQNEANLSENNFKESVQEKNVKFEKIKFQINELNSKGKLSKILFNKNIITSTSEFKRLIKQNGVKLNGKTLSEDISISEIKNGYQISLGKRKNIEINF